MSRKWKFICLGLFFTNILTLRWLSYINDERSKVEEGLGELKWGQGFRNAENDFQAGQFRIYSMKVVPYPAIGHPVYTLTNEFIGRTNGSLQIWTWPCYQPDDNLDLRMLQQQLDGYNGRMTFLYQYYQYHHLLATTNANIESSRGAPLNKQVK